jgi:hypothetical protein
LFVSGFTFVRNAIRYDYPVVESIRSILPLCNEFIVAVGRSDDNTRDLITSIGSPKIKILDTVWDDSKRVGGFVLSEETNKAMNAISPEATWAFYLQADEVIHEKYHDVIFQAMQKHEKDIEVEGLLFDYLHFYGSYGYYGDSRQWYRKEVRIIRNDHRIRSYQDAQGFRKDNRKLRVRHSGGIVYHYGWVKPPHQQQAKQESFNRYWHDERWMEKNIPKTGAFDYSGIDSLARFQESHPLIMQERIQKQNWQFSFDPSEKKFSLISRILHYLESKTGWRPGEYRNYKCIS